MPKRWAKPSKDEKDTCYGTLENVEILHCGVCFRQDDIPYSGKVWRGKVWRIDSFQAFGKRKFGELIDQPIGY